MYFLRAVIATEQVLSELAGVIEVLAATLSAHDSASFDVHLTAGAGDAGGLGSGCGLPGVLGQVRGLPG
jgi:hypothetical protein